jgi:hypothetical protein
MTTVPAALHLDDVTFPIEVASGGVRLKVVVPALDALQLVLARLCNPDATAEQRGVFARGEDFAVPSLSAVRMAASHPDAADAVASWTRFAGRPPGDDVYVVAASFSDEAIAVPRATLSKLLAELARLCDAVRVGDSDAHHDHDHHDHDPHHHAGGGAPSPSAAAGAPSPSAAAGAPSDELLRELERDALHLDSLDPEDTRRAGLPSEALDARTAARRRIVLLGLDEAGLLTTAAASDQALRARLRDTGCVTLLGYLDAVAALAAYYASPERAELPLPRADAAPLHGDVSLDWFRKASPPGPPELSAHAWLARCEALFVRSRPSAPNAGRTFTKVAGVGTWLHFRADRGPHVALWRAVLA